MGKNATRNQPDFVIILVGDVILARRRLDGDDIQFHRREVVRATFVAIEGMLWIYRTSIAQIAESVGRLTAKEEQIFSERQFSVTERGKIVEQDKHVPMLAMFRFTTRLAEKIDPKLRVDFGTKGWDQLRLALKLRHRITHPKSRSDIFVTDEDIATCEAAINWLFPVCMDCLEAVLGVMRIHMTDMWALLDDLKRGDPKALAEYEAARISLAD